MSNEDEIYRTLLSGARLFVAPRITEIYDPASDPTGFLDEEIKLMGQELKKNLPIGASFELENRVLGTLSLSPIERTELLDGIRLESERLDPSKVGARQRISALVDFTVRILIELNRSGARAAVTATAARQDQNLEMAKPPVTPAPIGGDPLVNALARFAVTGLRMIRGYIGESEVPGYRRLYSSLELTDYLDIPMDAIVQTADLRTIANPLGGAVVWIRVGSEVFRGRHNSAKLEVQGNFLRSAGGGWGGRGEEWTGPRGEEWTGPRGEEWTGPRGEEWTGPRG